MNEYLGKEIGRLKDELALRRREILNIEKLAGKEIDRNFQTDAGALSEKEIEPFFERTVEEIKERLVIKQDASSFTSHRRFLGRFILRLKRRYIQMTRFYMDPILEQQEQFNRHALDLHLASLSRFKSLNDRLRDVEARLSRCEEELTVIRNKLKDEEESRTSGD